MVSGTIKDEKVFIINTATLPDLRKKGYLQAVVSHLAIKLQESYPEVKELYACVSSGVVSAEVTTDVLDRVNALAKTMATESVDDPKAKNMVLFSARLC